MGDHREQIIDLGANTPARCSTVVVVADGPVWTAGDGAAPPICPACSATQDVWPDVAAWIQSGQEPQVQCQACGHAVLFGDWNLAGSIAVGYLGVVLDIDVDDVRSQRRPEVVTHELCAQITAALGGRWAYVHHHV